MIASLKHNLIVFRFSSVSLLNNSQLIKVSKNKNIIVYDPHHIHDASLLLGGFGNDWYPQHNNRSEQVQIFYIRYTSMVPALATF